MTVAELIAQLKDLDPDLPVVSMEELSYYELTRVEVGPITIDDQQIQAVYIG